MAKRIAKRGPRAAAKSVGMFADGPPRRTGVGGSKGGLKSANGVKGSGKASGKPKAGAPAANGKSKSLTLRDAAVLAAMGGDDLSLEALASRYFGTKPYYGPRAKDGLVHKGWPCIAESGFSKQLGRLRTDGLVARTSVPGRYYGVIKGYKRTAAGESALASFRKGAAIIATDHKAPKSAAAKGSRRGGRIGGAW